MVLVCPVEYKHPPQPHPRQELECHQDLMYHQELHLQLPQQDLQFPQQLDGGQQPHFERLVLVGPQVQQLLHYFEVKVLVC